MKLRQRVAKSPKKTVDTFPEKRGRGRPPNIPPSWIMGRASNYRGIFEQVWDRLWPLLSNVQSESDVTNSFQEAARPYDSEFVPLMSGLIFRVLRETGFPKRRSAQIGFLADSLGGCGSVTPRRSRDICSEWRAKEKKAKEAHHIIRYEFHVECSCGYKGRSRNHACAKCGATINFGPLSSTWSPFLAGVEAD